MRTKPQMRTKSQMRTKTKMRTKPQMTTRERKPSQSSLTTTPSQLLRKWTIGPIYRVFPTTLVQCVSSISENTGKMATTSGLDMIAPTTISSSNSMFPKKTTTALSLLMKTLILLRHFVESMTLSVSILSPWDRQILQWASDSHMMLALLLSTSSTKPSNGQNASTLLITIWSEYWPIFDHYLSCIDIYWD